MTTRILLAAAFVAGIAAPAMAQRSGTYAVEGVTPGGARYEGAVQLRATGPQTWAIAWTIAGVTTTGVGVTGGPVLIVGLVIDGQPGTGFYEVQADGRLVGRWTLGVQGGVGTETLSPR